MRYALLLLLFAAPALAGEVATFPHVAPDCEVGACTLATGTTINGVAPLTKALVFSACSTFHDETSVLDTDDRKSVWRAPAAVTITEVWCESENSTVTLDVQIDDGTPADVMGSDLECDDDGISDSTGLLGGMATGNRLDWAISAVGTLPLGVTVCVFYTYN